MYGISYSIDKIIFFVIGTIIESSMDASCSYNYNNDCNCVISVKIGEIIIGTQIKEDVKKL